MYADKLFGTVVYDENDPDERQDFVWHMTEDNVPSEDLRKVIEYLAQNNLIDIDKITVPITELNLNFLDQTRMEKVFDELFNVYVNMIDDGEETDGYFIHD